jgi:hypothetical protein
MKPAPIRAAEIFFIRKPIPRVDKALWNLVK